MVRINTGEEPVEELQRKLIEERKMLCEKAAIELSCSVEEIKFRINNLGVYEFQKMTHKEFIELTTQEQTQKQVIDIKKQRGVL